MFSKYFIMHTLFKTIFKFSTYHKIFIYFDQRYDNMQVRTLNNIIKIRGKIHTTTYKKISGGLKRLYWRMDIPRM